ncbi:hypothetical protein NKH77_09430 [Streptomyces sp. M19]
MRDSAASALAARSGRVLFDGYPTGVAVTWAQQHGGPWPATDNQHTSVGPTGLRRFLRPLAWQNSPPISCRPNWRTGGRVPAGSTAGCGSRRRDHPAPPSRTVVPGDGPARPCAGGEGAAPWTGCWGDPERRGRAWR